MSRIFPKSQKRQILEIFCKICFPYFARDKWSDHDSENCSEIRPVTRIRNLWRQSQILRKWPKIRAFQGSKSDSAFCKIRLPNFARDESSNHDFENCSKISSVTWFRICPGLLHFPIFMFFTPPYLAWPNRGKMAILDFSPCPGVFSGLGGWFLFQMASFGPLQSAGGVASSNFEFTHLSIHATINVNEIIYNYQFKNSLSSLNSFLVSWGGICVLAKLPDSWYF